MVDQPYPKQRLLSRVGDKSNEYQGYVTECCPVPNRQGKGILKILDKMNFMWVAYPDDDSGIFEENLPSQLLNKNRPNGSSS